MTMLFRRNTNTAALPASHTAELTFILPPDFSGGGVSTMPGFLMSSNDSGARPVFTRLPPLRLGPRTSQAAAHRSRALR
jgi:hypothetical protein